MPAVVVMASTVLMKLPEEPIPGWASRRLPSSASYRARPQRGPAGGKVVLARLLKTARALSVGTYTHPWQALPAEPPMVGQGPVASPMA